MLPEENTEEPLTGIVIPNNILAGGEDLPLTERINKLKTIHPRLPSMVVALSQSKSAQEACTRIRMDNSWFYRFPQETREYALELAEELRADHLFQARDELERALPLAVHRKIAALESEDENIAQRASTEIIDRVLGKPNQPSTRRVEKIEIHTELPWKANSGN